MKKETIDIHSVKDRNKQVNIAIGFFDGLHLGHQTLIKEVLKKEGTKAILSFERSFKSKLTQKKEELLLTDEEKDEMLSKEGIEEEFLLPFSNEIKSMTKEEFLKFLKRFNPKTIVVGNDFTFGKNASGKSIDLYELEKDGIQVIIKDLLKENNEKISSTEIKKLLKEKELEKANSLLGYPFFLRGKVIHGFENGRKISFPTANIEYPFDKLSLPIGVYKTKAVVGDKIYSAMTNIGNHPTIDKLNHNIVETYLLDFNEDLYGKTIEIRFLSFLREQKQFSSLEELKEQLTKDSLRCR